jgi:hypothetical protein
LWSAIDTNNVMMQRSNALTHFHGTLDGLDVLSSEPEYTDFNEHGLQILIIEGVSFYELFYKLDFKLYF